MAYTNHCSRTCFGPVIFIISGYLIIRSIMKKGTGLSYLFFIQILFQQGLFSNFLRAAPMLYLGKISFSLYMWHTMVMFPLKMIMPKINAYVTQPLTIIVVYGLLMLTLSLNTSHFSYMILENKLTRWLKKRGNSKSASPLTTISTSRN
ncbi:acyltransferase family protein [Paenibacillus sp. M.A.Huq-81]